MNDILYILFIIALVTVISLIDSTDKLIVSITDCENRIDK